MANTFTQIYLQFVFAVENRISLIRSGCKGELYKYITGIVQNNKHKLIAINGMPNHLHVFVGYKPHQLKPYGARFAINIKSLTGPTSKTTIAPIERHPPGSQSVVRSANRDMKGEFVIQYGFCEKRHL